MSQVFYESEFQVIGHVSQETAIEVSNYMLNGAQTPLRFWVETNPSYGQRVIRQVFSTRDANWFNPKPVTKYAAIALLFHTNPDESLEEGVRNGTSIKEPIEYIVYDLNEQTAATPELCDRMLEHYVFDDYQRDRILVFKQHLIQGSLTTPRPKRGQSTVLDELRKAKLELMQEQLRQKRLRNDELELQLAERKRKLEVVNKPVAAEKSTTFNPADLYAAMSQQLAKYYAKIQDGFSETQLEELRTIALHAKQHLPGTIEPFHLDRLTPIQLAVAAGKEKVDPRAYRADRLADISDPEQYARQKQMNEKLDAQYEETLKEIERMNDEWFAIYGN